MYQTNNKIKMNSLNNNHKSNQFININIQYNLNNPKNTTEIIKHTLNSLINNPISNSQLNKQQSFLIKYQKNDKKCKINKQDQQKRIYSVQYNCKQTSNKIIKNECQVSIKLVNKEKMKRREQKSEKLMRENIIKNKKVFNTSITLKNRSKQNSLNYQKSNQISNSNLKSESLIKCKSIYNNKKIMKNKQQIYKGQQKTTEKVKLEDLIKILKKQKKCKKKFHKEKLNQIQDQLIQKILKTNESNSYMIKSYDSLNQIKMQSQQQIINQTHNNAAKVIQRYWRQRKKLKVISHYQQIFKNIVYSKQKSSLKMNQLKLQTIFRCKTENQQLQQILLIDSKQNIQNQYFRDLNGHLKHTIINPQKQSQQFDHKIKELKQYQINQWNNLQQFIQNQLKNDHKLSSEELLKHINQKSQENIRWIQGRYLKCEKQDDYRKISSKRQNIKFIKKQKKNLIQKKRQQTKVSIIQNYLNCDLQKLNSVSRKSLENEFNQTQRNLHQILNNFRFQTSSNSKDNKIKIFSDEFILQKFQYKRQVFQQIFEQVLSEICKQLLNKKMISINRKLQKRKIIGIKTNLQSVKQFLNKFIHFILSRQNLKNQIIQNINSRLKPTLRHSPQLSFKEYRTNPFVVSLQIFDKFYDLQYHNTQVVKIIPYSWYQAIFQAFNQALNQQRCFGMLKKSYIWQIIHQIHKRQKITESTIEYHIEAGMNRIFEIINDPSTILFNVYEYEISEQLKQKINRDKIFYMLSKELQQQQKSYRNYNDKIIEIMMDVSVIMIQLVIYEACIEFRRLNQKID